MDYNILFETTYNNEILNICKDIALKQQKEGVSEEKINAELIMFLSDQIIQNDSDKLRKYQSKVYNNIEKIKRMKNWATLHGISKHALESCIDCAGDELKKYKTGMDLRYKILSSGLNELKGVFNEEWIKENYEELYNSLKK